MKNYIDETYLKGFKPEITKLLWQGETDYNKQKEKAEQIVFNNILNKGFDIKDVQVRLVLKNSGVLTDQTTGTVTTEDVINRMRFVYNVTAITGDATLNLYGSNDKATYTKVKEVTASSTGELSVIFTDTYKYYRLDTTPGTSIDYEAYLVETNYDLLFAFKWLELITRGSFKNPGDQFEELANYFRAEYDDWMQSTKVWYDSKNDGLITESEGSQFQETILSR